jgi:hypothetical protein
LRFNFSAAKEEKKRKKTDTVSRLEQIGTHNKKWNN